MMGVTVHTCFHLPTYQINKVAAGEVEGCAAPLRRQQSQLLIQEHSNSAALNIMSVKHNNNRTKLSTL